MWQAVWHFLLVINSNHDRISHRFRDIANYTLQNAHFSTSLRPLNPEFKMFLLYVAEILHA